MNTITLLGRTCHVVSRDDAKEVIADDGKELTDAEWNEYCRLLRLKQQAKAILDRAGTPWALPRITASEVALLNEAGYVASIYKRKKIVVANGHKRYALA